MNWLKELKIYAIVVLVAAFGMHHKQFATHPIEHIMSLPDAGAYGIGVVHPVVFGFVIYLLVWIPRLISKSFKKKASDENI